MLGSKVYKIYQVKKCCVWRLIKNTGYRWSLLIARYDIFGCELCGFKVDRMY